MASATRSDISAAVKILRDGGLVAFATETVYGLGADARRSDAVRKIFAAKGRPATNPLIVHVADEDVARQYAAQWPEEAERLAKAFWPGPLTLVVAKDARIVPEVTAGLASVALRVPAHPLALELLREFGGPVAAPSANKSGRVSPTTAEHVRSELGDVVDLILDGGPCQVGIESTVLDLASGSPRILRPGGVSKEQIENLIGSVVWQEGNVSPAKAAPSPGMQESHYSPRTPMFRFEEGEADLMDKWLAGNRTQYVVLLWMAGVSAPSGAYYVRQMPSGAAEYARQLYTVLREADELGAAAIWVQMPPDRPEWAAVRDRLKRASKRS